MTSLDEAYSQRQSSARDPRRTVVGLALVGAGVVALVVAMAAIWLDGDGVGAKRFAGTVAGLGIPALLLGVVVVLPASSRSRLGVVVGTLVASVGVFLFRYAYPNRWTRTAESLAFETAMFYGVGCAIALWFVFTAIATFKRRNNPQGTVRLEVVRQGETKTVRVTDEQYESLVNDGGQADRLIEEIDEE